MLLEEVRGIANDSNGIYGMVSRKLFEHWDYKLGADKDSEWMLAAAAGPRCSVFDIMLRGKWLFRSKWVIS